MRGPQAVFDADMHVQEPPGIWVEFLDPSLRGRVAIGTREQAVPLADSRPLIELPAPPQGRREMRPTMMEDRYGDLARRGVRFDQMPKDEDWGWREARLSDPAGNRLCLYQAAEYRRYPPWRI